MIVANERAQDGLELFEINGSQSFEMTNDTLKICADDDGTIWRSVRGLDVLDADGNCVFSLGTDPPNGSPEVFVLHVVADG